MMYAVAIALLGFAVGVFFHPLVAAMLAVAGGWFGWRMDVARRERKRREAATPLDREPSVQPTASTKRSQTKAKGGKRLPAYKGMYLDLDIVGESHRQNALRDLWRGPDFTHTAVLTPEADNPYDTNAVRVDVEGSHVGYLSRETALLYREFMDDAACQLPVHFVKGGREEMIGVFTGRSKKDREQIRAAIDKKTKTGPEVR